LFRVSRGDDLHPRADADVAADGQSAGRVEEALLPDPRSGADAHAVLEVPLQDRLVADVDVLADVDRFRVKYEHAVLEDDSRSERREVLELELSRSVRSLRHSLTPPAIVSGRSPSPRRAERRPSPGPPSASADEAATSAPTRR